MRPIGTIALDRPTTPTTVVPPSARLSINQITTRYWTLQQDLVGYEETGVTATGVLRRKLDLAGAARGVAAIRESGIDVSSLSWTGGFTGTNGRTYEEAVDDGLDAIEQAVRLGARTLVVFGGARSNHILTHARRLVRDGLLELADVAERRGVRLAVQPMLHEFAKRWSFLSTLDETLELIADCDHPAVGLSFDLFHLWREPRIVERIPEIVDATAIVRLNDSDSDPGEEGERRLPGDGAAPVADVVAEFERSGYRGYYEFTLGSREMWSWNYVELLQECRRRFEELLGIDVVG